MQRLNTITNNSSPYSDDGWVDPDETDAWAGLKNIGKKLLNFGGRKEEVRFRTVLRGLCCADCDANCVECAEKPPLLCVSAPRKH